MNTRSLKLVHRACAAALVSAAVAFISSCASDADSRTLNTLTASEKAAGWTSLFDGLSAANFRGYKQPGFPAQGWAIRDGVLCRVAGAEGAGDIITREQYGDFEFACDWRVSPGGNSGIIYRCTEDHGASYETGPEYQILDDAAHVDGLHDNTRAGAMYDLCPVPAGIVHAAGQWNSARIVARGAHIEHWLNGVKVVDIDMASDAYKQAHAKSKWTGMPDFGTRMKGHIVLQDHGDEVCFRNIRVRPLN